MPLNDASCAVVVICDRMPLYWVTRLLRTACADASTTGADAVVKAIAVVSVPPIAPPAADRTEGRRSIVVGGGDRQLAGRVERRVQVIGQQRGIELVERLDRAAGAVAEGDVDRRAAVEGGEGQGLAGEAAGRRGAARGEAGAGSGVAGQAERRERIAGADDRQVGGRAGARSAARRCRRSTKRPDRRRWLPWPHRWRSLRSGRRWQDRSPSAYRRSCRPAERRSSCRCRR